MKNMYDKIDSCAPETESNQLIQIIFADRKETLNHQSIDGMSGSHMRSRNGFFLLMH